MCVYMCVCVLIFVYIYIYIYIYIAATSSDVASKIYLIQLAVFHKSKLCGHLPSISETNQVRKTRHPGNCWRSKDKLISDVLLRTPSHGRASVERPARTTEALCAHKM